MEITEDDITVKFVFEKQYRFQIEEACPQYRNDAAKKCIEFAAHMQQSNNLDNQKG